MSLPKDRQIGWFVFRYHSLCMVYSRTQKQMDDVGWCDTKIDQHWLWGSEWSEFDCHASQGSPSTKTNGKYGKPFSVERGTTSPVIGVENCHCYSCYYSLSIYTYIYILYIYMTSSKNKHIGVSPWVETRFSPPSEYPFVRWCLLTFGMMEPYLLWRIPPFIYRIIWVWINTY